MVKTQIYLTEDDYERLRTEAFYTKRTMSQIIRELVRTEFNMKRPKKTTKQKKKITVGAELEGLTRKYGFSGPRDLASNVDVYLYGKKK